MAEELGEIQIEVGQLEIGMYVARLDRPWEETDFLIQGFLITSPDEIDALTEQCEFVYIESRSELGSAPIAKDDRRHRKTGLAERHTTKSAQGSATTKSRSTKYSHGDTPVQLTAKSTKTVSYINKIPVEQEFAQARLCYKYAKLTSKSIMDSIRIGRVIDVNECRDVVDDIVDSILRNNNALTWLTKMKNKDDYTAEHSLNVCILSVMFARHLGLQESEIRTIGLCGLLHDIGKAKIPLEILNKPGRFTDEELEVMKQHSTFGRDLLMTISDTPTAAIDVAYCHHERLDQQGYPRGLQQHQIPYYAKLISITDTYDAITSSRVYDNARSSMVALDIIYKNRGRQFDEELALEFIKCIGVYPPGAIVEMTNGEVAIVIASNKDNKLKPRIMKVLNAEKQSVQHTIINLADNTDDSEGDPYRIKNEVANGTYGLDIKEFLKRGLKLRK
ncbi:MAG: HD-GYP domain-containing protein [Kangiellaceae bacterium]|nr:HD-GYP domain-containing protein [Kangiellaceae bacterium]